MTTQTQTRNGHIDADLNVAALSDDALRQYGEVVQRESRRIAAQLDESRAVHGDNPTDHTERKWRARARAAATLFGAAVHRAAQELARRKRAAEEARRTTREAAFIAVCRRDLDETEYAEMWEEAGEIAAGRSPWPGGAT